MAYPVRTAFRLVISNVVATADLGTALDLVRLDEEIPDLEYSPDQFSGAILPFGGGRAKALLFRSGKVILVGLKREAEPLVFLSEIQRKIGIPTLPHSRMAQPNIVNIVATGSLGFSVDIPNFLQVAGSHDFLYDYEPPRSLLYKNSARDGRTLLISRRGRLTVAGFCSRDSIRDSVRMFLDRYYDNLIDASPDRPVKRLRGVEIVEEPERCDGGA